MGSLTKNEWRGLWAVLWRVLLIVPFAWLAGGAFLTLVLLLIMFRPVWSVCLILEGSWLKIIIVLTVWILFLPRIFRLMKWTLSGLEYGSL